MPLPAAVAESAAVADTLGVHNRVHVVTDAQYRAVITIKELSKVLGGCGQTPVEYCHELGACLCRTKAPYPSLYSACNRSKYVSHLLPITLPQVKHRTGIIMFAAFELFLAKRNVRKSIGHE